MAKTTKAPAKVSAKDKAKAKEIPKAAPAKASAKAPAKSGTTKTAVKAPTSKAAPAKTVAKVAPTKTASAPSKASPKAAPAKTAPVKASSAKAVPTKASSASTASAKALPVSAKAPASQAAAPASKTPVAPKPAPAPVFTRPVPPVIPRPTESVKPPVVEEYEDAFSDVPQEPEQFSPVPMASRLHRTSVRYSDKDLDVFRVHIEAERKKAMEEFQILRENLDDLTNSEMADENASYSMHMAEQGTDAQEKEKLYAHVQRVSDYIKKLDEALQRIQDKVYGICKMCGILIAKERLLAVPITTQSASYKLRKRCPEDGVDRIVKR
jgi:RNA polymerase-binding transcription factor DksA